MARERSQVVAALRAELAAFVPQEPPALPGRRNHRRAGVMIPLRFDGAAQRLVALATVRPRSLSRHPGEVCFPGGPPEQNDADLRATALREAEEELGITGADVLGRLSSVPVFTSEYRLEPWVAVLPADAPPLAPQPAEVESVLELDVDALLAAPVLEAVPYELGGRRYLSPIFRHAGELMYGATAHAFFELLQLVARALELRQPHLEAGDLTAEDVFARTRARVEKS